MLNPIRWMFPARGPKIFNKLLLLLAMAGPLYGQNTARMNSGVNAQTVSPYTVVCSDALKLVTLNSASAFAVNLPSAATCGAGYVFQLKNLGAGLVTITPLFGTIDGSSGITLSTGSGVDIYNNGTNYFTQSGRSATLQTNGTPNALQSILNFQNGSAVNGLTIAASNPSGGIEQFALSGTLNDAGLTSAYSGVGNCPANQFANAFSRNSAPGCAAITMDTIPDGAFFNKRSFIEGPLPVVYNGDFEGLNPPLPPPGWDPNLNMTCSYETVTPYEGLRSLKCLSNTDTAGAGVFTFTDIPVIPGETFYVSGAVKTDGVVTANIAIRWIDKNLQATSAFPGDALVISSSSTSWVLLAATGVVPSNAVFATLELVSTPFGTAGTTWYDFINVYRVSYPPGQTIYNGATSGSAAFGAASVAGTPNRINLPTTTGTNGQCLQTNGANPQQTSWGTCGSFTNPMTTLGDIIVENSTPAAARLAGPTTPNGVPQILTNTPSGGAAALEAWALPGVPTNAQTGTTYTIAVTDRASYVTFSNAGSIAVTLPSAASAGFGSNFVIVGCDIGTGTATITPTTSNISYSTGSAYTSAASTLALTTGQCAWIYSDNTNYFAIVRGGATSSPTFDSTGTGLLAPVGNGSFTFPNTATTGFTLSGTAPASVSTSTGTNAMALLTITGVTGGADSNATGTAGIGSSPSIAAGAGGAGTGTNAVGGAGGAINLTAGAGGASLGTGANANGGNIVLTPGAAGTGGSGTAGLAGVVSIAGSTAGFIGLTQGSAVTTTNTNIPANTIIVEAPTSVTAYARILAGAAATGIPHYTNASSVVTETITALGVSDYSPNTYVAGGGTAQAQTATLSPAAAALTAGLTFCWKPAAANTAAAPTMAVNGLTATAITKLGTTALVANDITTSAIACVIYDGTQFELQNPQTNVGGGGGGTVNQITSATGAIATWANGNNPLVINCALTSGTTCLTTGETTAATTAGAVEHQITTLTTSTAIGLQITQGANGPASANAPAVLNVSAAAAGGLATASQGGFIGAPITLLTGAGSAGGATTGNGGAGGAFNLTTGGGGAAGGTTTNNGGTAGAINLTTGNGASGGSGASTAGNGGDVVVTLGVAGTVGTTPGRSGQLNVTGTAPASTSNAAGLAVGTLFNITGVTGGASSNAAGTGGIGSVVSVSSGIGGAGTGTNAVGGAGGAINLTAGAGGASLGTGANANGGNIVLTPGAAGTGGSGTAGLAGVVSIAGSTAGFIGLTQGSAVTTTNTNIPANTIIDQAPTAVTAYAIVRPGVSATGILTGTVSSAVITQGFSGDSNHSAVVTIGSGTSIGSTTLCSSANCPAGTYVVHVYVDITTACGTSGSYTVNLIYTDDQGAKTVPVNLNGTGAVPASGVITTTSTANFGENSQVLRLTSGNLNYSTTAVACGTAGPMVGKLYMAAVPVQ